LSGPPEGAPAKAAQVNNVPSTVTGEPSGNGFVVQVAAVNDRREAETIARRLAGKGYPSFVTTPGKGTPSMFRVRIGKYTNRREAESIANRLEKEEQFKPWITK
jgi:cell division septation protein DedD